MISEGVHDIVLRHVCHYRYTYHASTAAPMAVPSSWDFLRPAQAALAY